MMLSLLGVALGCTSTHQMGSDIVGEGLGDRSGYSVSLSNDGKTIAIGAPRNSNTGSGGTAANAGHVRVLDWSTAASDWVQRGADIDSYTSNEHSGISVALSNNGNTVAIGARGRDGETSCCAAGSIRVFDWSTTTWVQRGIDIFGEADWDESGHSIAMSDNGSTLAIGGYLNDGSAADAGHARVFDWVSTTWVQRGDDLEGEAAGDQSGWSVALSHDGNTVAIGGNKNDGGGTDAGHTRVFDWNLTVWVQRGDDIDGEAAGDESGWSIALTSDGNTLAIGAHLNKGGGTGAGHVRVFDWTFTTPQALGSWVRRGADIDGAAMDRSGWSVALSSNGNSIAIGSIFNTGSVIYGAAHTRVLDWSTSADVWIQRGSVIDGDPTYLENHAISVALSDDGSTVAFGTCDTMRRSNAGYTRVFCFPAPSPPTESPTTSSPTTSPSTSSSKGMGMQKSGKAEKGKISSTSTSTEPSHFTSRFAFAFSVGLIVSVIVVGAIVMLLQRAIGSQQPHVVSSNAPECDCELRPTHFYPSTSEFNRV